MVSGKALKAPIPIPPPSEPAATETEPNGLKPQKHEEKKEPPEPKADDDMIMIERTYTFAGKRLTEKKRVPRSSAEAKLYLSTNPEPPSSTSTSTSESPSSPFTKPKRPPRKARRSAFEPIPDALLARTDLHFGSRAHANLLKTAAKDPGKKLNTVEKSAMDWAGFVDKEGIADELDAAGKAKGAYKARQEFLARVEGKREIEERRARGLPV